MNTPLWSVIRADGIPVVATAIHDGHAVRPEIAARLALDEQARLREEDPFTSHWVDVAPNQIIVNRSRFEVDLNRPRERAVYITPDDAWGLNVWTRPPDAAIVARSLAIYDEFYRSFGVLLDALVKQHGKIVVLDLHSYNHRRKGPDQSPADPEANPEVNLGTGSLNRQCWAPVVDAVIETMRNYPFHGHSLDVRENVKFTGGNLVQWIHNHYPTTVCGLAMEFKKTFMDEWTGRPDLRYIEAIRRVLADVVNEVVKAVVSL